MNATHVLLIIDAIGNVHEWMRGTKEECERTAHILTNEDNGWSFFALKMLPK